MSRTFVALMAVLFVTGCASLPKMSSGKIGCAADDIKVSNDSSSIGSRTWDAECKGAKYHCAATTIGMVNDVSCSPSK